MRPVGADVGDLVRDDQMVLGIDGHLDIVADDAEPIDQAHCVDRAAGNVVRRILGDNAR